MRSRTGEHSAPHPFANGRGLGPDTPGTPYPAIPGASFPPGRQPSSPHLLDHSQTRELLRSLRPALRSLRASPYAAASRSTSSVTVGIPSSSQTAVAPSRQFVHLFTAGLVTTTSAPTWRVITSADGRKRMSRAPHSRTTFGLRFVANALRASNTTWRARPPSPGRRRCAASAPPPGRLARSRRRQLGSLQRAAVQPHLVHVRVVEHERAPSVELVDDLHRRRLRGRHPRRACMPHPARGSSRPSGTGSVRSRLGDATVTHAGICALMSSASSSTRNWWPTSRRTCQAR